MELSLQEIAQLQGTRKSEIPPWESFSSEMETKISPELADQIARYEERMHHKSSQEAEETLARERELSNAVAAQYRWVTKEEYGDIEPRIGRIMHSTVFLQKLKNCGFKGWYAEHPMKDRYKLILDKKGFGLTEGEYVCWLQAGFTTEFTVMRFDEHDIPLDERYRGWRTPLLQIQLKGILTEEQVEKEFGKAVGPASKRYNKTLYEFRNRKVKVI